MRPTSDVEKVFDLRENLGWGAPRISAATGVSVTQVGRWLRRGRPAVLGSPMRAGGHEGESCPLTDDLDGPAYAYLLGQYLGDGSIVRVRRTQRLEISTTAAYSGIRQEVHAAIEAVIGRKAHERRQPGAVVVASYGVHWLCLFPQHGPGRKHERPIVLDRWQEEVALDRYPGSLLRGLIHSDGWRGTNVAAKGEQRYLYDRYQFTNHSPDIRAIFGEACDRLGIAWRPSGRWNVYVSRREAVAELDRHIGPKY